MSLLDTDFAGAAAGHLGEADRANVFGLDLGGEARGEPAHAVVHRLPPLDGGSA